MNCPLLFSPPFTEENFLLPIAMPYLLGIFFKPSRGNVKEPSRMNQMRDTTEKFRKASYTNMKPDRLGLSG